MANVCIVGDTHVYDGNVDDDDDGDDDAEEPRVHFERAMFVTIYTVCVLVLVEPIVRGFSVCVREDVSEDYYSGHVAR